MTYPTCPPLWAALSVDGKPQVLGITNQDVEHATAPGDDPHYADSASWQHAVEWKLRHEIQPPPQKVRIFTYCVTRPEATRAAMARNGCIDMYGGGGLTILSLADEIVDLPCVPPKKVSIHQMAEIICDLRTRLADIWALGFDANNFKPRAEDAQGLYDLVLELAQMAKDGLNDPHLINLTEE